MLHQQDCVCVWLGQLNFMAGVGVLESVCLVNHVCYCELDLPVNHIQLYNYYCELNFIMLLRSRVHNFRNRGEYLTVSIACTNTL